jgi:HlyD family secretion protein
MALFELPLFRRTRVALAARVDVVGDSENRGSGRQWRMPPVKWWGYAIAAAVVAAAVVLALKTLSPSAPEYRTAKIDRGSISATVAASGTLNATTTVKVGAQISGRISEVLADFNSPVTKGQLIARIDPSSLETRVQQAEAALQGAIAQAASRSLQVERARSELEGARLAVEAARYEKMSVEAQASYLSKNVARKRDLLSRGNGTAADLDKAEGEWGIYNGKRAQLEAEQKLREAAQHSAELQLKIAESELEAAGAQIDERRAALNQARVELGYTYIYAPVNGVIVWRNIEPGQTISVATETPVLFVIAEDLSKMQIEAYVDEADIVQVAPGQPVSFTVDALVGNTYSGVVKLVRPAPDSLRGGRQERNQVVSYAVIASVDNPGNSFRPGMTANIQITVAHREGVLRVPTAALRFAPQGRAQDDEDRVWVLERDGTLRAVEVDLGLSDGKVTELLDPKSLAEGDTVVTGQAAR